MEKYSKSVGKNVGRGKDDTLFALMEGFVKFEDKGRGGKFISVYPAAAVNTPDQPDTSPTPRA